jgi:hypothetical protein
MLQRGYKVRALTRKPEQTKQLFSNHPNLEVGAMPQIKSIDACLDGFMTSSAAGASFYSRATRSCGMETFLSLELLGHHTASCAKAHMQLFVLIRSTQALNLPRQQDRNFSSSKTATLAACRAWLAAARTAVTAATSAGVMLLAPQPASNPFACSTY